jgi:hypothetical protein
LLEIDRGQKLGMLPEVANGRGIRSVGAGHILMPLACPQPGGQKAAGIAAAGNGGQEVDILEQPARGQHLHHAETEGRRADAAAG